MKNPIALPEPDPEDQTEGLLQSLIAECRQIIRDVVLSSAQATADDAERRRYLVSAVELMKIGASAGDAIARLRGGATPELRQRITVERVLSAPGKDKA